MYSFGPARKILKLSLIILLLASPVFAQTMNLDETMSNLGGDVEFRWDPFFASGTFSVDGREVSFVSGRAGETGTVLLGHRELINLPLPYLENGNIRFPGTFVDEVRNSLIRHAEEETNRFRIGAIIIDPGHGGVDPGTVWDYTVNGRSVRIMEKDIALRTSRMLQASLRAAFPDKRILLTRSGDYNLSLEQRTNVANSIPLAPNEVAIFVSIHANSSLSNRNARGFEVFYLNPNHRRDLVDRSRHTGFEEVIPIINWMMEEEITTDSILLANFILRRMDAAVGNLSPNRGLKSHDWFVVRNALMPAILVEMGFVSNREEALRLNDDAYLMRISDALYKGISDFVAFIERPGGFAALQ